MSRAAYVAGAATCPGDAAARLIQAAGLRWSPWTAGRVYDAGQTKDNSDDESLNGFHGYVS